MAIHPNNKLIANHHLLVGETGSMKTSWLKFSGVLKKYTRVFYWDPEEDHNAHRFYSLASFCKALHSAVQSGKAFKIALTVDPTPENYEQFCKAMWLVADGRVPSAVVVEEKADCAFGVGKTGRYDGYLMRKGRKYNVHVYITTQRAQEVDKTCVTQSVCKWVGFLSNGKDIKYMSDLISVPISEIGELEHGHFIFKRRGSRTHIVSSVFE